MPPTIHLPPKIIQAKNRPIYKRPSPEIFFFRIYSKVNQIIFSLLPIYSSSYEVLAQTVFEIFSWQGKNAQLYKGPLFMPRCNRPLQLPSHYYQSIHQVMRLSSNSIWGILLIREKCPNLRRTITHKILFRIYSKVNQAICSSLPIISPSFKALAPPEYFPDNVKMPIITKNPNSWSMFPNFYSKANQVIYSSILIYSSSFKTLASIVYEIFCWQGKNVKIHKGPLLIKYFSEFIQKLTRSFTHQYQSIHQVSRL